MKTHRVPASIKPMGVYRYIRRAWPLLSDNRLREAFQKKDVRINGVRAAREEFLRGGDELTVYLPEALFSMSIKILFDDGRLLVVEKPAGLPVDVDRDGIGADTALERVRAIHPSAALCHRLDTDTGGVMLIALDEEMRAALLDAFRKGEIEKTYRALLVGVPEERGSLTGYLIKDPKAGTVRMSGKAAPGALSVRTDYVVIEARMKGDTALSYVEIDLKTGRTHQIRAHFASIGYPLLGDDKYGDRAVNKRLKTYRPCLWCVGLALRLGDRDMRFESPDPF